MSELISSKWVDEFGVYYPIDGNTQLHQTPGNGIFELYQSQGQDKRIGLKKIANKFEFNFKLYDLDCSDFLNLVKNTWESDIFVENNRNLGIILNGIKGTGKTLSSKILCNKIGLPVIMVTKIIDGMISFIQSLEFECIILIDEAEKTFKKGEDDELLVKLIDGVYNRSRKLYILTTNKLDINENLLGRPGRIRYIKEYGNLSNKAVKEFLDDNLKVPNKRDAILEIVDLLEISTIDILRNIVEEVNIHGDISENSYLNVPKSKYIFDILRFEITNSSQVEEIKNTLKGVKDIKEWLSLPSGKGEDRTNEDELYDKYRFFEDTLKSKYSTLWKNSETSLGILLDEIDEEGFVSVKGIGYYSDTEYLIKIIGQRNNPSLYRGDLI